MGNVYINGIYSKLGLDTSAWTSGLNRSVQATRDFGQQARSALDGFASSAGEKFGQAADAARSFAERFRSSSRSAGESVAGLGREVTDSVARINQQMALLAAANHLQQFGMLVGRLGKTIRAELTSAASAFSQFNSSARNANLMAGLDESQLARYKAEVRDLSTEFGLMKTPRDLVDSLYAINSFGFKGADGLKVLKASAISADAGILGTATWADALGQTLNALGLQAKDAMLVSDQLFTAIHQGGATLHPESMAANIGDLAPTAKAAGVSLQELLGAYALMTTKGGSAAENATQLRQLMLHLIAPTGEAKKILQAYGVEVGESAIRTKGLNKVLEDLFQKTGGNKEALSKILDVRAMQSAIKLMGNDGGTKFAEAIANQNHSAPAIAALDQQRRETGHIIGEIKANLEAFEIAAFQALGPKIAFLAGGIRDLTVSMVGLGDGAKVAIGAAAALAASLLGLSSAALVLAPNFAVLSMAIQGAGGLGPALSTIGRSLAAFGGEVAAMLGPIALAIAAVAGLAYAWQQNWGGIQDATRSTVALVRSELDGAWQTAIVAAGAIWEQVGADITAGLGELKSTWVETWPTLREALSEMWSVVRPTLGLMWEFFRDNLPGAIRLFADEFKTVWTLTRDIVSLAWGVIKPILQAMAGALKTVVDSWNAIIVGDWKRAWTLLVDGVKAGVDLVVKAFEEMIKRVLTLLGNLGSNLYQAGQRLTQSLADGLRGKRAEVEAAAAAIGQAARVNAEILPASPGVGVSGGQTTEIGRSIVDFVNRGVAAATKFTSSVRTNPSKITLPAPTVLDKIGVSSDYVAPPPMIDLKASAKSKSTEDLKADAIVGEALKWNQTYFRKDVREQCANFVRYVFSTQGVNLGSTSKPVDWRQTIGLAQGPGYANSFFGKDIGELKDSIRELKRGDIIGFRNTYGDYKPGTITHVGIYAGDGQFVHRSTSGAPVRKDSLSGYWGQHFAAGVRPFALGKGGFDAMGGAFNFEEAAKQWQKIQDLINGKKQQSAFDGQREGLKKEYDEAIASARQLGAEKSVLSRLDEQYARQVQLINEAQARESTKVIRDLSILRLEAEGKFGEAARTRIIANYNDENQKLEELKNHYSSLAPQIAEAQAALKSSTGQKVESADQSYQLGATGRQAEDLGLQRQLKEIDLSGLKSEFSGLSGQVDAAYSNITKYLKDPSEALRENFQQSVQVLERLQGLASQRQQDQLRQIDFERAMGAVTKQEAIDRQAEILNHWKGGEESRRGAILQMVDTYRGELQSRLQMQGEYNLETLEQMQASFMAMNEMTAAQQAELAAVNALIMEQRQADQQQYMGTLQQAQQAFGGFLQGVFSGQQSFSAAFSQLWKTIANQVIGEIVKMIVKATILQKLLRSIFGFFGGIFGGIFGGGLGAADAAGSGLGDIGIGVAHTGGLVVPGGIATFHTGGLVGGGLMRDEVLAKLQVGEIVLSRNQVQSLANQRSVGPKNHFHMPITINGGQASASELAEQIAWQMDRRLQGVY